MDGDGNIFIADNLNHRIRMVDARTGKIDTVAGKDLTLLDILRGVPCDSGDGGPANQARFCDASAVAVDQMGDILVADFRISNRIRRIDKASGKISTVVGTGTEGFFGDGEPATSAKLRGPTDIAVLPGGSFVFTDTFNHRIRRVR